MSVLSPLSKIIVVVLVIFATIGSSSVQIFTHKCEKYLSLLVKWMNALYHLCA